MKTLRPKFRSSEKGMTLLEIVLAMGLSTLVLMTVVTVYTSYTKKIANMNEAADSNADVESGQQIMLKDLKSIDPSFGILKTKDDKNLNFFDYFPDVPEQELSPDADCSGRPCRIYTMRATGPYSDIVFVLHDSSAHEIPSLIYDPISAYQFPLPSCTANCRLDGLDPTFVGINQGGVIGGAANSLRNRKTHLDGTRTIVDWPGYWHNGQLLMLDSPTLFRPEGSNLATVAPRPPFFIGIVNNVSGIAGTYEPLPSQIYNTKKLNGTDDQVNLLNRDHPVIGASYVIDSADKFLKKLPANGGGQPMIRLRPVKLVRYTIELMYPQIDPNLPADEKKKRTGALRVYRQVLTNGIWDPHAGRQLIAEKVKFVQFRRNTVTDKAVMFDISKTD